MDESRRSVDASTVGSVDDVFMVVWCGVLVACPMPICYSSSRRVDAGCSINEDDESKENTVIKSSE